MKNSSYTIAIFLSTSLLALANTTEAPKIEDSSTVAEFDNAEVKKMEWQIVDDGVMGGLSKGNLRMTKNETMVFSGNLSLENNGGFSSVRSADVKMDLKNYKGLTLRVNGDGRTYQVRLASDARFRSSQVSFMAEFETTKDEWTVVKIPFKKFEGSWRGMDLPDKVLNTADIQRVGLLIADKKEGPFAVEVDWIRPYGKAGKKS
ncbi:MAG: CIA30 family protein [Verrucomicrobiota bacterium]